MKNIIVKIIEVKIKNGSFRGVEFLNVADNESHLYIDGRVIPVSKLNEMILAGTVLKVTTLEENELRPVSGGFSITNGKNNILGQADIENGTYKVRGGGGSYGENKSYSYIMAHLFSRCISNDTKIYKIENTKINF